MESKLRRHLGAGLRNYDSCGGVEAKLRSGRRPAVADTEMTGDAESDELTEWQEVGWVY